MGFTKTVPHHGPLFEAMMQEIDAQLSQEGCEIQARPINAVCEVGRLHGVSIPIAAANPARLPPELAPYVALGGAIMDWYRENYGERLKVDMKPGRMVVQLDGDYYTIGIPRLLGATPFCISRHFLPLEGPDSVGQCNIIQLIEYMTPARAARLSDASLKAVEGAFICGLSALYTLETTPHELMASAQADVATAVTSLMGRHDQSGMSKWASLQAAEKVLKAAIDLRGKSYPFIHDLTELSSRLLSLGVEVEIQPLLDAIQCSPRIRYGQESCTRSEALAAHHASLDLVNVLRAANVGFVSGLGG